MLWDASYKYQQDLVLRRTHEQQESKQNVYQPGDFILHLESHRPSKLDSYFQAHGSVIQHIRNNVEARHLSDGVVRTFHVSRVKPFFGSKEDAFDLALRDKDQFVIKKIFTYKGDPNLRLSLLFHVAFVDGDLRWLRLGPRISLIRYLIEEFCRGHPQLHQLLFTTKEAQQQDQTNTQRTCFHISCGYYAAPIIARLR
jgi:hypothetical protein